MHWLREVAQRRHPVSLHQSLDGLQNLLIFATHQNEGAGVAPLDELAHELDAVHLWHVQVQQNQIRHIVWVIHLLQRPASAVASRDLNISKLGERAL